jgi:hypothetical protein
MNCTNYAKYPLAIFVLSVIALAVFAVDSFICRIELKCCHERIVEKNGKIYSKAWAADSHVDFCHWSDYGST